MKLKGTVNKIERIAARKSGNGIAEEKRVYSLTVRLPDPSLRADYSYGYGNMSFIAHGNQMQDFIDLGAEVDVYVVPKDGGADVPQSTFHDMQSEIYRLEGELRVSSNAATTHAEQRKSAENSASEARARLNAAMQETIRLTAENEALRAVRGVRPADLAQLGFEPAPEPDTGDAS